ncbi:MAG: hypothetical protein WAW11_05210 [Patescibacteria group bacterium]
MKFTTIVIIEASSATLDNIRTKLPELTKTRPTDLIIQAASLIPDTNMTDQHSIAKSLAEQTGYKSGVDEQGIYLMTPLFKDTLIADCVKKIDKPLKQINICDSYDVFDLDMTDNLLSYIDNYDRFPDAILLPDLSLVRADGELSDWKDKLKEILKPYANNSFSLILDCHV